MTVGAALAPAQAQERQEAHERAADPQPVDQGLHTDLDHHPGLAVQAQQGGVDLVAQAGDDVHFRELHVAEFVVEAAFRRYLAHGLAVFADLQPRGDEIITGAAAFLQLQQGGGVRAHRAGFALAQGHFTVLGVGAGKGYAQSRQGHAQVRAQSSQAGRVPPYVPAGEQHAHAHQYAHHRSRGQQRHGLPVAQQPDARAAQMGGRQHNPEALFVAHAAAPAQPGAEGHEHQQRCAQGQADAVVKAGVQPLRRGGPELADHGPHGGREDDRGQGQQHPGHQGKKALAAVQAGQGFAFGRGGQGHPEGHGQSGQDKAEQGRAHAAVAKGVYGVDDAAAHQVGGEKGGHGGQRHHGHIDACEFAAAVLHNKGVQ